MAKKKQKRKGRQMVGLPSDYHAGAARMAKQVGASIVDVICNALLAQFGMVEALRGAGVQNIRLNAPELLEDFILLARDGASTGVHPKAVHAAGIVQQDPEAVQDLALTLLGQCLAVIWEMGLAEGLEGELDADRIIHLLGEAWSKHMLNHGTRHDRRMTLN